MNPASFNPKLQIAGVFQKLQRRRAGAGQSTGYTETVETHVFRCGQGTQRNTAVQKGALWVPRGSHRANGTKHDPVEPGFVRVRCTWNVLVALTR